MATSALAEDSSRYPRSTLILLAAPWCAPCYREIAQIDRISAAAQPFEVRVLLVEDGVRARAMVKGVDPARLWQPPAGHLRRIRADLLARTPGLPYAIVTDEEGRICAERSGSIDTVRARQLVTLCRQ